MRAAPAPNLRVEGLPDTIDVSCGRVSIRCSDFQDLMQQLVLLAQTCDGDSEGLRLKIEGH